MIGIYYFGIIIIWAVISGLIFLAWKMPRRRTDKDGGKFRKVAVMILFIVWFGGGCWIGFGRNLYWDTRIRFWCAKDGGLVVNETVELPPGQPAYWGPPFFYATKGENALGDEYIYERKWTTIKKENPSISKLTSKLYRKADHKLLGQYIYYSRNGGGIPGPAHPSKFKCPDTRGHELLKGIFIEKENRK